MFIVSTTCIGIYPQGFQERTNNNFYSIEFLDFG